MFSFSPRETCSENLRKETCANKLHDKTACSAANLADKRINVLLTVVIQGEPYFSCVGTVSMNS